jgi:hypothetical protein
MLKAAGNESESYKDVLSDGELQKPVPEEILVALDNEPTLRTELPDEVAVANLETVEDRGAVTSIVAAAFLTEEEQDEVSFPTGTDRETENNANVEARLNERLGEPIDAGLAAMQEVGVPTFAAYERSQNDSGQNKYRVPPKDKELYDEDGKAIKDTDLSGALIVELTDIEKKDRDLNQIGRNANILVDALYGTTEGKKHIPLSELLRDRFSSRQTNIESQVEGISNGYEYIERRSEQGGGKNDRSLVELAVKLYILKNPQDAQRILTALASNEPIDLVQLMPGQTGKDKVTRDSFSQIMGQLTERYLTEIAGVDETALSRAGSQRPTEFKVAFADSGNATRTANNLAQWRDPRTLFKGITPDNTAELADATIAGKSERRGDRLLLLSARAMQESPKDAYLIMDTMLVYTREITTPDSSKRLMQKLEASQTAEKALSNAQLGERNGQRLMAIIEQNADMRTHEMAMERALLLRAVALMPMQSEQRRIYEEMIRNASKNSRNGNREELDRIRRNILIIAEANQPDQIAAIRANIDGVHMLRVLRGAANDRTTSPKQRDEQMVVYLGYYALRNENPAQRKEKAKLILNNVMIAAPVDGEIGIDIRHYAGNNNRQAVNRMWAMYREHGHAAHIRVALNGESDKRMGAFLGKKRYEALTPEQRARAIAAEEFVAHRLRADVNRLIENPRRRNQMYQYRERIIRVETDKTGETAFRLQRQNFLERWAMKPVDAVRSRLGQLTRSALPEQERRRGDAAMFTRARRFVLEEAYRQEADPKKKKEKAEAEAMEERRNRSITSFIRTTQERMARGNMSPTELEGLRKEVMTLKNPKPLDVLKARLPKVAKQMVVSLLMTAGVSIATTTAPVTVPLLAIGGAIATLYGGVQALRTYRRQSAIVAENNSGERGPLATRAVLAFAGGALLNAGVVLQAVPFPANFAIRACGDLLIEGWKIAIDVDGKRQAKKELRNAFAGFDTNLGNVLKRAKPEQLQEIAQRIGIDAIVYNSDGTTINRDATADALLRYKLAQQKLENWNAAYLFTGSVEAVIPMDDMDRWIKDANKEARKAFDGAHQRITSAEAVAVGVFAAYQVGKIAGSYAPQAVTFVNQFSEAVASHSPEYTQFEANMRELDGSIHERLIQNGVLPETANSATIIDIVQHDGVKFAVIDMPGGATNGDMLIPISSDGMLQFNQAFLTRPYAALGAHVAVLAMHGEGATTVEAVMNLTRPPSLDYVIQTDALADGVSLAPPQVQIDVFRAILAYDPQDTDYNMALFGGIGNALGGIILNDQHFIPKKKKKPEEITTREAKRLIANTRRIVPGSDGSGTPPAPAPDDTPSDTETNDEDNRDAADDRSKGRPRRQNSGTADTSRIDRAQDRGNPKPKARYNGKGNSGSGNRDTRERERRR